MNKIPIIILSVIILVNVPLSFAESIEVELDESLALKSADEKKGATQKEVELDESLALKSADEKEKMMEKAYVPPLKQIKQGIEPSDVQCKSSMELVFSISGDPSCVKEDSVKKLLSRGWIQ